MIPHKNLFSGALGKLKNIGGSRAYTTPHTVSVNAEYSINLSYNVQGDLVGHSLDGRLWLYRRSRRLGIIALKWNTVTGKLEYSAAQNISNNDDVVLACGLDWVLTNNNIFMVTNEGGILSTRLFDANIPNTFLYSLLRSGDIGASGIDPFTGQAWGMRNDNGNSEGTGYFSKNTHLLYSAGTHAFEQCYSLLPPVGDWQIFENFLVRRPDAETITSYNHMQAVRPLIPLEFANGSAAYGTGYNFDHRGIQLFHRDGEIWGKGFQDVGKISLLPAVFSEDGIVQEYYLYIQPDFTFYPYSDFFYCTISTFDVNPNKELFDEGVLLDYVPVIHSFAVSSVSRTWAEAKAICEMLGGHLATSTSADKNTFLSSLTTNRAWIGGTDEAKEGSWKWITGEELSYTNWGNKQPDNSGSNEHYLETNFGGAGLWNDNSPTATRVYICEWDFELDENVLLGCLWNNIAVASIGSETLYGFLSEQADAISGRTCFKSVDGRILLPETGEFLTLSEDNARIFFDALSYKCLLLDSNGGQLILGEGLNEAQNVNCKTLRQWLAPTGYVDAVTDDYIAASADNSAFCTSLVTGFNRQFLSPNTIPLTAGAFQNSNEDYYRLAISDGINSSNRKLFGVNKILSQNVTPEAIQWQDIYKEAVKIEFLNSWEETQFVTIPFAGEDGVFLDVYIGHTYKRFSILPIFLREITITIAPVDTEYFTDENGTYQTVETLSSAGIVYDNVSYFFDRLVHHYQGTFGAHFAVPLRASAKIFFIHPDTGQPSDTIDVDISCNHSFASWGDDKYQFHMITYIEIPSGLGIHNGKIGWRGKSRDFSTYTNAGEDTDFFKPVMNVPEQVQNWYNYSDFYLSAAKFPATSLHFQNFSEEYAVFSERFSTSLFLQQLNSEQINFTSLDCFYEFPFLLNKQVNNADTITSTQNIHVVCVWQQNPSEEWKYIVFVFRSKLSPDMFNFYAETERSKLH